MILTPKLPKLFKKGEEFAEIYGFWALDEFQNSKVHHFGQSKGLEVSRRLFKLWCSEKPKVDEIGSDYQVREGETVFSINIESVRSLEFETEKGIETVFEVYFT